MMFLNVCSYILILLSTYIVLNAQLVPENPELIADIIFPEVGDPQVTIPANAIIHQRKIQGTYVCTYNMFI